MASYKTIILGISALCLFRSTHIVASEANEIREQQENRRSSLGLLPTNFLHTTEELTRKISSSSLEARQKRLFCAALAAGCSGIASMYILAQQP